MLNANFTQTELTEKCVMIIRDVLISSILNYLEGCEGEIENTCAQTTHIT
jgi:hypothetical protein